jgi:hypothetical protein
MSAQQQECHQQLVGPTTAGDAATVQEPLRTSSGIRGYDVVRSVLGLVLLLASVAKGYDLAAGVMPENALLASPWVAIGLVTFEALFGGWLLVGRGPRFTYWLALACFAAFLFVAVLQGLGGRTSCGCLGRIPVSPWLAAAFDSGALIALVIWRPGANQNAGWLSLKLFAPFLVGAAILLSILSAWAYYDFGSLTVALAYVRGDAVAVNPRALYLGEGTRGTVRSTSLQLVNLTDDPITVIGWNSSGCVGITELPTTLLPRTEQSIQVNLGFVGRPGPFTHRVLFYTSDQNQPALEFRFSGRIRAPG